MKRKNMTYFIQSIHKNIALFLTNHEFQGSIVYSTHCKKNINASNSFALSYAGVANDSILLLFVHASTIDGESEREIERK
jgi:hypothetical protein